MTRFSVACLFALLPLAAGASIVPTSASISGTLGGPYTWTYQLQLSSDQGPSVEAQAGIGADAVEYFNPSFTSFFTVHGFAGYIAGSCSGPSGWICTAPQPADTVLGGPQSNAAAKTSITWIYVGAPLLKGLSGDDVGLFHAMTIYDGVDFLSYAARAGTWNSDTLIGSNGSSVGLTLGAAVGNQVIAEPGSLALSSIALGLLGLWCLRRSDRRRTSSPAAPAPTV